jgi:hypothetical protein
MVMCVVGAIASAAACLVGLLPPSQLGHANVAVYVSGLLGGMIVVGLVPPVLLLRLRRPGWKAG